jgi:uncharacterized protein with PIN domain
VSVRIIGHAKDQKHKIVCTSCSAVLEYVNSDVVKHRTSHMGENCVDGWIKCPGCGADVHVGCFDF